MGFIVAPPPLVRSGVAICTAEFCGAFAPGANLKWYYGNWCVGTPTCECPLIYVLLQTDVEKYCLGGSTDCCVS